MMAAELKRCYDKYPCFQKRIRKLKRTTDFSEGSQIAYDPLQSRLQGHATNDRWMDFYECVIDIVIDEDRDELTRWEAVHRTSHLKLDLAETCPCPSRGQKTRVRNDVRRGQFGDESKPTPPMPGGGTSPCSFARGSSTSTGSTCCCRHDICRNCNRSRTTRIQSQIWTGNKECACTVTGVTLYPMKHRAEPNHQSTHGASASLAVATRRPIPAGEFAVGTSNGVRIFGIRLLGWQARRCRMGSFIRT